VGGILGAVDGLSAWFTPEVRAAIIGIVVGSTVKGVIAGIAAGWFARKVNNVLAGIAFGLVVGALLAYGVVAMQGGKYFWEIMLPGSAVGAIAGWATQRYGRPVASARGAAATAMMLCFLAVTLHAADTPKPAAAAPSDAATAFAKLKTLAGTWSGNILEPDGPPVNVEYRVTGEGSIVVETLFAGAPHEMITMYTLDGNDLVASHYCSAGNQPTLKLDRARTTADELVFEYVSVRGEHASDAPHIHDGVIDFAPNGRLEAVWHVADPSGKVMPNGHRFYLSRTK
jgi:uncharacterized membrane protein (Fun14 family)